MWPTGIKIKKKKKKIKPYLWPDKWVFSHLPQLPWRRRGKIKGKESGGVKQRKAARGRAEPCGR